MFGEKLKNYVDSLLDNKPTSAVIAIFVMCLVFAAWGIFAAFAGLWLGAVFVGKAYGVSALVVFISVIIVTFRLELNGKNICLLPKSVSSVINFAFGLMGVYLLITTPYWGAFATFLVVTFWVVALLTKIVQVVKLLAK